MADGGELDDETIGGLFARLIDDGRDLVRAEIALHLATWRERVRDVRGAIVLVAVAALLVATSFVGLAVGCVLALSRWIGPFGAGLVVTLLTLLIAGLLGWLAARRFAAAADVTESPQ